jgi:hypothetical protein
MFTKSSNSIVLKKSGEIMINTQMKNAIIFISLVSSPSIKIDSLIIPTINTNHINKFAQYNKINLNKLYYRETIDPKETFTDSVYRDSITSYINHLENI